MLSEDGRIGLANKQVVVRNELFSVLDHPTTMSIVDKISINSIVENLSDKEFNDVKLTLESSELKLIDGGNEIILPRVLPRSSSSVKWKVKGQAVCEDAKINLKLETENFVESSSNDKQLKIFPIGEPDVLRDCKMLGGGESTRMEFVLQGKEQSGFANMALFVGVGSTIIDGAERLLTYPHGCCEQTHASTLPLCILADYLTATNSMKPNIESRLLSNMRIGRDRFISLYINGETGGCGLWDKEEVSVFHTALVLGLFGQLRKYIKISSKHLVAMEKFLVSNMQEKMYWKISSGDYTPFPSLLDDFATTAYVLQSVSHYKKTSFTNAVTWMKNHLAGFKDDITVVSILLDAVNKAQPDDFKEFKLELADLIIKSQKSNGGWANSKSSLTKETAGTSIESTSYAIVALCGLKIHGLEMSTVISEGVEFLLDNRTSCGYNSTRDTLYATLALSKSELAYGDSKSTWACDILFDEKNVMSFALTPEMDPIERINTIYDMRDIRIPIAITKGKHSVSVVSTGENAMRVLTEVNTWKPIEDVMTEKKKQSIGEVKMEFNKSEVKLGEDVQMKVTFHPSKEGEKLEALMIEIPLPSGFTQTKKMSSGCKFDYVEVKEEVLCCFKSIVQNKFEIKLDLKPKFEGKIQTNVCKVYPMYQPELKVESNLTKTLSVKVE